MTQDLEDIMLDIALEIGYFYNTQDDYMDIFGETADKLKLGVDIQTGACTWVMLTAMKNGTPQQRTIITENFGNDHPFRIEKVKKCLLDIGIPKIFEKYQETEYNRLLCKIQLLPPDFPKVVYLNLMKILLSRKR